jgi:phosphatidylserine/phosphatidylglycerophosphate/cardiolipin synthase-like enzyme
VGEARARAIIDYRKSHGSYTSLEQLTASKTVGQSTYEAIKPYLMISGDSTLAAGAGDGNSPLTADGLFSTKAGDIRVLADRDYYQALLLGIDNAKERIDLTMFLFKATGSPQNRPARLVRALGEARDRGVDVRVILEQSDRDGDLNSENQRVAEQLRKRRVRVDFDSLENTTHAKLVVIDHRWLFTGSHNLTEAALSHNREFSLLIDDPDLANHATAYLMKIR